jgi:hypothetical protein
LNNSVKNIIRETIFETLNEELCARGKAYIKARKTAGEKSSAYLSGRAVKVCKGQIKFGGKKQKSYNEEINASDAYRDEDALQTVIDGKRNLGFISLKHNIFSSDEFFDIIKKHDLGTLAVPSNDYDAFIYYNKNAKKEAEELRDIAEKYGGYLAWDASEKDSRRIGQLLGYKQQDIDDYINKQRTKYPDLYKENISTKHINLLTESLRNWFKKEDWVRIDTQGNITGPCGTMKKGKATTRCLPRAKAQSLTKAERAATARKKAAGSKKGKQFVPNTSKSKVKLKK